MGEVVLNHQKFLEMDPIFKLLLPLQQSVSSGRLLSHIHGDRATPLEELLADYVPSLTVLKPAVETRMARSGRAISRTAPSWTRPVLLGPWLSLCPAPVQDSSARVSPTLSRVVLDLTFSSPRSAPCS